MALLSIKGKVEGGERALLSRKLEIAVGGELLEGVKSIKIGKIVPKEPVTVTLELYVGELDLEIPIDEVNDGSDYC